MPSEKPAANSPEPDEVLAGGGEMGARMRAFDWSRTPLGPVKGWPQTLRTCVRIVLTWHGPRPLDRASVSSRPWGARFCRQRTW
jgi:hypothetical protein